MHVITCTNCGEAKPNDEFYVRKTGPSKGGYLRKCKVCSRAQTLDRVRAARDEVYSWFGGRCNCNGCEVSEPMFLSIDHINNDGAEHRRALAGTPLFTHVSNHRSSGRITNWLKRNPDQKDRFQLLCLNCNMGKYRNRGSCPREGTSHVG